MAGGTASTPDVFTEKPAIAGFAAAPAVATAAPNASGSSAPAVGRPLICRIPVYVAAVLEYPI